MSRTTVSFEELEALHDVLEAARCFWHARETDHPRAIRTLRLANQLYWRIGEELPKTGTPSERFQPVHHSPHGTRVEQLLEFMLELTRRYAAENDPWWADTVLAPSKLIRSLSAAELSELHDSMRRLGLSLT